MELYNYQKEAVAKAATSLILHKYFAMFCDMGTGKTVMALATIPRLTDVASVLIVAPKSIIHQWRDTADKWNETLRLKEAALSIEYTTYESLHKVSRNYYSMIILDESVRIKNSGTLLWKRLTKLTTKYKLILNGCPIADSPMDIFNQFKWLDPQVFGFSTKVFELRYAYDIQKLRQRIEDVSIVIALDDVMKEMVPSTLHSIELDAPVPVRFKASAAIEDIPKIMTHPDTLLSKIIMFDKLLKEIDVRHNPAIVFTSYRKEVDVIKAYCVDANLRDLIITGDTPASEREEYVNMFRNGECDILILQIKCGQFGLNLETSHIAIYFSLMYSYTTFAQSKARIYRIGQTKPCEYYCLIATTIDEAILNCLLNKESFTAEYFEALKEKYIVKEQDK